MKINNLSKSVEATMSAFEEKVKRLEVTASDQDKLASLKAHIDKQVEIPLDYIRIEDNVRRSIDTSSIKFSELVESIKTQGLLQNLVVDLRVEEGIHQLFCIAGQRRLLAAREAGKSKANCLIKQFSDPADRIASGLAENLTREDLHCLDIAEGFAGLMANGWSEEQIASQFERNPRTIRRYLTIAGWPENALKLIRKNQDTFTTKLLFNELVSHKYDSEEELIKVIQSKIKSDLPLMQTVRVTKPNSVKLLEKQLKSKIQMRVSVKGNEQEGKLTISYSSMDELQKIKDMLLPVNE